MKLEETTPERLFALTVTVQELQFIVRALYKDSTNEDENGELYGALNDAAEDAGIARL